MRLKLKTIVVISYGSPDVLEIQEVDNPSPIQDDAL